MPMQYDGSRPRIGMRLQCGEGNTGPLGITSRSRVVARLRPLNGQGKGNKERKCAHYHFVNQNA